MSLSAPLKDPDSVYQSKMGVIFGIDSMRRMCDVKNRHQDWVSSDGIIEPFESPLSLDKTICPCHCLQTQNKWISVVASIGVSQSTVP